MYSNGYNNQHMHRNGEHQFTKNRFWVNQNGTGTAPIATEFINGSSIKQQKGKQPGESLRKPLWDVTTLMPFQKNFYVPHQNIASSQLISEWQPIPGFVNRSLIN